jgi:DinB family protein
MWILRTQYDAQSRYGVPIDTPKWVKWRSTRPILADMSDARESLPEPWLRGPIPGVDPLLAPVLYALQQAREDLARYTEGLSPAQIWNRPHGFGSVGFHLRHIAGSTSRLLTYLQGRELTAEQVAAARSEPEGAGEGREELLAGLNEAFRQAEAVVRSLNPGCLAEPRWVGRKRLPTTVAGLLTHIMWDRPSAPQNGLPSNRSAQSV